MSMSAFFFRPSEGTLRQLFDFAVVGIFQSSSDGRNLVANQAFAQILGYEDPEEVRAAITDVALHFYADSDRRRQVNEMIARNGGRLDECESEVRRKDGRIIWISENTRIAGDADTGQPVYLGCISDVTARKLAELALAESEARLRQEIARRRRAEGALERAMSQALVVCDADGGVDFCSDRAAFLLREHFGQTTPLPAALRAALAEAGREGSGRTIPTPAGGLVVRSASGATSQGAHAFCLDEPYGRRLEVCLRARGLSARESEVVHWVAQAKTSQEIAGLLGIAEKTVKKHLQRVYARLGVENRTAAVVRVSEWLEQPAIQAKTTLPPC